MKKYWKMIVVAVLGFSPVSAPPATAGLVEDIQEQLCFWCSNTARARNQTLTALAAHSADERMLVSLVLQETRKSILSDGISSLDNSFASMVKTTLSNHLFGASVEMVVPARVTLGIDLGKIQSGQVFSTGSGVSIQLPPVIVISVETDLNNSKLTSKTGLLLSKDEEINMLTTALEQYKTELRREVLANNKYIERAKAGAEKAIRDILEPHLNGVTIKFIS